MNNFFARLRRSVGGYFALGNFMVPQADAEKDIRDGVSFRGPNILILVIAILIASLGLNTNSTAVIIGAMLISPLMGPIIGIGLGVGIQDFALLKRSLRNLAMAAGFSVIASTLYFLISPVSEGHSELLARTSPTIYDVLIGFFGGAAGILAIGSRSKGNVIPGVAIATALMPPLCTAGYGLATMQPAYFLGAFYLFLINSIYIGLATFIGVKLMNYKCVVDVHPARARRVRRLVYSVAVLTLLPSIYLTYNMLRENRFQMNATRFVNAEFDFPGTHVLGYNAAITHGDRTLTVTLIGRVLPVDSLELALNSRLKFYGMAGTVLNIVQGSDTPSASDLSGASMRDIYELAQNAIAAKQTTIDSLRAVMALRHADDSLALRISPELKVLFPQVRDISVNRSVFSNVDAMRLDTVSVAMVVFSGKVPQSTRARLCEYLQARLGLHSVSLVEVPTDVAFPSSLR